MSGIGRFTIRAYCICGGAMTGSGAGDLDKAEELTVMFWTVHQGDDHRPTDAKGAAAGRRKAERRVDSQLTNVTKRR